MTTPPVPPLPPDEFATQLIMTCVSTEQAHVDWELAEQLIRARDAAREAEASARYEQMRSEYSKALNDAYWSISKALGYEEGGKWDDFPVVISNLRRELDSYRGLSTPAPREDARCLECGHFEVNFQRACEVHERCPSCNEPPHWIRVLYMAPPAPREEEP